MGPKRKPLIAANWKMFKTIPEAVAFATALQEEVGSCDDREVVIAPPFTALHSVREVLSRKGYSLSAQNCHWEEKGAFTGEISPVMLKGLGCDYVIVGHSERRQIFGETDEMIGRKTVAVLETGCCRSFVSGRYWSKESRGGLSRSSEPR